MGCMETLHQSNVNRFVGCKTHGLASTVRAHDERQGPVELDHIRIFGREASDALDEHLCVSSRHNHRAHLLL